MSTNYNQRRMPSSWGIIVTVLLTIGGMSLLLLGSILYSSPTATQQPLVGMSLLIAGGVCFVIFVILLLLKRNFLFPPEKKNTHTSRNANTKSCSLSLSKQRYFDYSIRQPVFRIQFVIHFKMLLS
jgi:hypothetical protein